MMAPRERQIVAANAAQAREQLKGFSDGEPCSHAASFHFFERTCPVKAKQRAREILDFLQNHSELTNLRFTLPYDRTVPYGGIVEVLAKGFARVPHVKQVDWSISGNWHCDDADFPATSSVAALRNLIAENTTLEGIFIHMPCEADDAVDLIEALDFSTTIKTFVWK